MKKEYQNVISEALGVRPILINSALVCAQNRKRLYWTNIPFMGQPEDRGILLKHILEVEGNGFVINRGESGERGEKAMCLDANYFKGVDNHGQRTMIEDKSLTLTANYGFNPSVKEYLVDRKKQMIITNVNASGRGQSGQVYNIERKAGTLVHGKGDAMLVGNIYESNGMAGRIYSEEGKSPSLKATTGGNNMPKIQQINPAKDAGGKQPYMQDRVYHPDFKSVCVTAGYAGRLNVGETMLNYRKLTVTECERLQGVPDGYCQRLARAAKQISNTQAYKMLGNGWQIDTIEHLLEPLKYRDIL